MTTKEQLQEALEVLASQARCFLERIDSVALHTSESVDYRNAYQVLNDSLNAKPKVKVLYEYKLQRADGKYLDKSTWSEKGKTYKTSGALMTALGSMISEWSEKDPNSPRFDYIVGWEKQSPEKLAQYQADFKIYLDASKEWRNQLQDRNIRAKYIPDDWKVIAIAINTGQSPIETSAKIWYASKKK